jgi:hypothetical protein
MPEIRTVQYSERKIAVVEDPNPTYSRIFIDAIQHDLTTLTPSWTKQWHYNSGGIQYYATGNTYNQWNLSVGPGQGIQRALGRSFGAGVSVSADVAMLWPATDDGFFRAGIMHLANGTISTFATGDSQTISIYSNTQAALGQSSFKSFASFQVDTYWQTLDYKNYPATKLKLVANGTYVLALMPGDRGVDGPRTSVNTYNANDGWFLYGPDITAGSGASYSIPDIRSLSGGTTVPPTTQIQTNIGTSAYGFTPYLGSTVVWEDAGNGYIYTINTSNPNKPFAVRVGNYTTNSPTFNTIFGVAGAATGQITSAGSIANAQHRIFFAGVDNLGNTIWVSSNDFYSLAGTTDCGIRVGRVAANLFITNTSFVMSAANANTVYVAQGERARRLAPSNIRRDNATPTRWVFYSPHYDAGTNANPSNFPPNNGVFGNANLIPLRWTIDIAAGNVQPSYCNVAYPGSNGHQQYAAPMSMNQTSWTYDTTGNGGTWGMKPHQFLSNGNTYITFWITDQMALSNPGGGQYRWPTPNTRTMMTYQIASGTNDNFLTFHSSYTFYTLADIPKNFMPINANATTMIVPQTYKTSFMKWTDNIGWQVGSVYNTEFRGLGQDSTGRIWGYAMDKNNGNIHIITPTLPVNVSVIMAATNFTYTGTAIPTTAVVNAYDYNGNRLAANVQLTIDGSTMLFSTNSSKSLTVGTSNSADTTVNLNITGGGINNIYAAISV